MCAVDYESTGSNGGSSCIVAVTSESPVACTLFFDACRVLMFIVLRKVVDDATELLISVRGSYNPCTGTVILDVETAELCGGIA